MICPNCGNNIPITNEICPLCKEKLLLKDSPEIAENKKKFSFKSLITRHRLAVISLGVALVIILVIIFKLFI